MRGSAALCLVLACLAASHHVSQPQHEQLGAAPSAQQQQQWRQEQRSLLRTRRQLSRVVILYRQLAKENRDDQSQARQRIQDILDRVFAAPDVSSTVLPATNRTVEAEEGGNATTTSTARPPPRIDRTMLLANLRRNLRGLGRLFMRELRAALSQTRKNFAEYGTQLRNSIG